MITKEQFVSIMDKLKKQHDYDRNFTRLMGEAFPETYPPIYDNSKVMDAAIESLKLHFNGDDTIEWWIYETDFGMKDLYILSYGYKLYLKNSGSLYDYLSGALLKETRLQRLIDNIKSGGRPTMTGHVLTSEIVEELIPYINDQDYVNLLKSRIPKK